MLAKRNLRKKIYRKCLICGKQVKIFLYTDGSMRGGHYFGKLPLYSKKEMDKTMKSGTHKENFGDGWIVNVLNYAGKPYSHEEYWECPTCYWHKGTCEELGHKQ